MMLDIDPDMSNKCLRAIVSGINQVQIKAAEEIKMILMAIGPLI